MGRGTASNGKTHSLERYLINSKYQQLEIETTYK